MEDVNLIVDKLSTYGNVSVKELPKKITIDISNIINNKNNIFICIGTVLDTYYDKYPNIDRISFDDDILSIKLKK